MCRCKNFNDILDFGTHQDICNFIDANCKTDKKDSCPFICGGCDYLGMLDDRLKELEKL